MIKRVVDRLSKEFPNLKTFATLSPIPGFLPWLRSALSQGDSGLLLPSERKSLSNAAGVTKRAKGWPKETLKTFAWRDDETMAKALRPVLTRLCARYLAREKRASGAALDPVAHFHLSNGARMERLNWMGDRSASGMRQSAGLMINYRYDLAWIDANHESYRSTGGRALSSSIKSLLDD